MNNPLSDGNENVIDIFVLGKSETGTQELMDQLEHQEYRVTLFADGPELIETLYSGKPNLVICDTTSYGQEAYDYCRQIKADDNLWMIPVMILTRASSLGDLLYVLDSNADNFIAQPYDSPYLLSLIEGMLSTPVERQTTDQIKTQFKIQHDERIFVVTADRRKLLEFLLSAFEIAVKNSEDLSAACAEQQALSVRVKTLEDTGSEQERVIGMLSANVKKKEQDERKLKGDLEETEQALDEKTAEVGKLSRDLGDARTLLATAEENIRILLDEKEKTAVAHQSETSLLNDQISSLSQEIRGKTTGLETAQQALETETTRSAILELAVREITAQKEHLDTIFQALNLEKEELVSALSQENDRAHAAEGEMQSVFSAKVKTEQELTRLVDVLREAALRQNDEILHLRSDLDTETSRYTSAEKRLESLRQELEQLRATHEAAGELQLRQSEELQARYDTTVATLFAQERDVKVLKDELAVAQDENKKSAAFLASVKAASNETRVEIEEREWKIQSLEKQIADIGIQKATSDEKVRALTASLESVQEALNAQKAEHAALGAKLEAAIRERDTSLQSVRSSHEETKNDLDLQKNNLTQLNRDLEAAALLRSTLQGDIATASSRIKELEHELKSTVLSKDQNGQQVRSLAEELGVLKTTLKETSSALAAEKEQHVALQDQLKAAIRERDETLQSVRGAHDQTKTDLDGHRNDLMRLNRDLATANQLNATLLVDFNAASARIAGLEGELNSVVKGKEQTGQQARSLSDDLERTQAELETERRIRRTAEVNLQKSTELARRLEGEIARSTAEREGLKLALEQERKLHTAAEEKIRTATQAKEHVGHEYRAVKNDYEQDDSLRAAKIQKLNKDFEEALARQRVLALKVTTLESEKAAAETRADALSDEIQQARTALADEWVDHMNDEERLAATEKKAVLLEQSLSATGKAAPERKWAVVVKQTGLPAEIRPAPQAIVVTPPAATPAAPEPPQTPDQKAQDAPSPGIEDLFEDDPACPVMAEQKPEVPPPPVHGSVTETRGMIAAEDPAEDTDPAGEHDAEEETDGDTDDDGESEKEAGDPAKNLDDFVAAPSSYGISFNRQQWLGLLKWSHHSGALSQEQRMQIVRMGRLIQNGRRLTKKQDEQVREMMVLVQTLGYKFH